MRKFLLPMLLLASAIAVFGSTTGVSPCVTATLATYEGNYPPPSIGCSIGILDYSNFNYVAISNAPSAGNIDVTPSSDGFGFTQANGQPFVASKGEVVQFAIYYNIFIDPAPVIHGDTNSIDPPQGNVSITEYFCNDFPLLPPSTTCYPPGTPTPSLTVTTANPTGSIIFNPPATKYQDVGIVFTLDGTNGVASFDGLDTATSVVSPEPASLMLIGLFLAAGGYKLRRSRQN